MTWMILGPTKLGFWRNHTGFLDAVKAWATLPLDP